MRPGTGEPPCGDSVNVELFMVLRFISSLNSITILSVVLTPVAPFAGASMITVGGVTSPVGADVVKLEVKAVSGLPATSVAPLVTFTV
jgi:hypothetical protein